MIAILYQITHYYSSLHPDLDLALTAIACCILLLKLTTTQIQISLSKSKTTTEVLNDEEMVERKEIMERWRKKKQ